MYTIENSKFNLERGTLSQLNVVIFLECVYVCVF